MTNFLVALVSESHHGVREIKSPIIGRAKVCVEANDIVVPGQIVLDIYRVQRHYLVRLPEAGAGTVIEKNYDDKMVNLAYGEVFMRVHSLNTSASIQKETAGNFLTIDAPMDGMFYLSDAPESPPFVRVGDEITKGQTLGLIEVMKCFYPLKYQGNASAKIISVSIKNATPITTGTTIFQIAH